MPEEHEPTDDELEHRLKHLLGEDGEATEKEVDPIEAKLSEIEEKTKQIRERNQFPDPPDWNYQRPAKTVPQPQSGVNYRGVGIGFAILYAFIGPILLGMGIGWLVDHSGHTGQGLLWGTLIGALGGFIGGIAMVVRLTSTGPKQ